MPAGVRVWKVGEREVRREWLVGSTGYVGRGKGRI